MTPNHQLGVFRIFPAYANNELVDSIRDLSRKYHQQTPETLGTQMVRQKMGEDLFARYDELFKHDVLNTGQGDWSPTMEDQETFYDLLEEVETRAGVRDGGNTDLDYRQCDRWPVPIDHEPWLCTLGDHLAKVSNNAWGLDLHYINQVELLRYRAGEKERGDHYDWHNDAEIFPNYNTPQQFVDCPKFQRKLTIISN